MRGVLRALFYFPSFSGLLQRGEDVDDDELQSF